MQTVELAGSAAMDETALWDEYGRRIYAYLLQLLGNRDSALDLTQETFLRAIRSLRKEKQAPANLAAWLFRIATNLANDQFRRRRLIQWLPFVSERDGGLAGDVADEVTQSDLVRLALQSLPKESAAILLLRDVEGFSLHEIAETLGQNYEAVKKRMARAREAFRAEYVRLKGAQT